MTALVVFYLINILVTVFVLAIWVIFIRNLIRSVRAEKRDTAQAPRNQWDKAQPQTVRQAKNAAYAADNVRDKRRTTNPAQQRNQMLQELLARNPKELYQLLKENLPDSYQAEIEAIFKSPRPMFELVKFIRRKDVWPVLQSLPDKIKSAGDRKMELFEATKKSVPEPIFPEVQENAPESYSEMDKDILYLSEEIDAVNAEYDGYADFFGSLLGDVPTSQIQTRRNLVSAQESKTGAPKRKLDSQWLRDAVIASTILEKLDT